MNDIISLKDKIFDKLNSFLIIGAMDGIKYDGIFGFLKKKENYISIFIEPIPYYYNILCENLKQLNGRIFTENVAISNIKEIVEIVSLKPEYKLEYPDYFDGCSSVLINGIPINPYIRTVNKEHLNFMKFETMTVAEILLKYNLEKLDYLQIDAEGYDERIIESIDIVNIGIKALRFELVYLSAGYYESFRKKMNEKNYITVIDGEDVFCVSKDYIDNIL
jgi:FkbM family methyltransferase